MENKAFTLNVPPVGFVKEADYVGIISGKEIDKFDKTGLTPIKSGIVHAPYVNEFPIVLECQVIHTFEIGLHTQFIGEILNVMADESVLDNQNKPEMEKVKPFIYDSSKIAYYEIGNKILDAFTIKSLE
jgi:flavin reductase (DIM6/NTAB) family NADH-FMN oxidoreductase RutF